MKNIDISVIKSRKVCSSAPYFVGVAAGKGQLRMGFWFFHLVVMRLHKKLRSERRQHLMTIIIFLALAFFLILS